MRKWVKTKPEWYWINQTLSIVSKKHRITVAKWQQTSIFTLKSLFQQKPATENFTKPPCMKELQLLKRYHRHQYLMQKDGVMFINPGQMEHQKELPHLPRPDKSLYWILSNHSWQFWREDEKQISSSNTFKEIGGWSDRLHSTVDYSVVVWICSKKVGSCIKGKW